MSGHTLVQREHCLSIYWQFSPPFFGCHNDQSTRVLFWELCLFKERSINCNWTSSAHFSSHFKLIGLLCLLRLNMARKLPLNILLCLVSTFKLTREVDPFWGENGSKMHFSLQWPCTLQVDSSVLFFSPGNLSLDQLLTLSPWHFWWIRKVNGHVFGDRQ